MRTLLIRWLLALGLVLALGVAIVATPARAHASLIATSPADGSRIETAPEQVSFEFSEPVELELGGLAVLDSSGDRVDEGAPELDGTTVSVQLRADLPDDTYIATYRVVSEDGHPVNGAIVFTVGATTSTASFDIDALLGDDQPAWEALAAVFRFVAYVVALIVGGMALYSLIDPSAFTDLGDGTCTRVAAAVGAVASMDAITLQDVISSVR